MDEISNFWHEMHLLTRVEAQYQQMYYKLPDPSRAWFLLRHAKYLLRPRLRPTIQVLPTPARHYDLCVRCQTNRTEGRLCEPCRVQLYVGSQLITPHQYPLLNMEE